MLSGFYIAMGILAVLIVGFIFVVMRNQEKRELDTGENVVSRKHPVGANRMLWAYILAPIVVVLLVMLFMYYYS